MSFDERLRRRTPALLSVRVFLALKRPANGENGCPDFPHPKIPRLGLWRKRFQTSVRFVGNRRVWKLLLKLLVNARGFLRVALAQHFRQLQQRQRPRNENGGMVRQITE